MNFKKGIINLTLLTFVLIAAGCSEKKDTVPVAPANSKAVLDFIKGKKLVTKSIGLYDNFIVNGVKEVKWMDVAKEKNDMIKEVVTEEMSLSLQFINDTAVTVLKNGKTYNGTYRVDDKTDGDLDEKAGIKLKLTYNDPDAGFGMGLTELTYSYPVLGIDEKRIMLETPRSVNRQNLIALLTE
ncbi:MAG: hypothetical protein WBP16_07715 [Ferruginibacter sp.]